MSDEERVRELVRRVVRRAVGAPRPAGHHDRRGLVTELDLEGVAPGGVFRVPDGALVTPLARQAAMERKISLVEGGSTPRRPAEQDAAPRPTGGSGTTVAIGADHGGFEMKEGLKAHLAELGHAVLDCGTDSKESVDYPDFALAVARLVAEGRASCGVLVDGAGIGSCMAANKVPGVRAAMCYDEATAVNSRDHNHANVLTLGAAMIDGKTARKILAAWLATPPGGGRHGRRVDKIMEIEKRYSRKG